VNRQRAALAAAGLPLVAVLIGVLAACTPTVALEPAADAADPACAAVTVRLPSEIDEGDTVFAARETNAQATGAWGDPTVVVLHCGVAQPAPTSDLPCNTVVDRTGNSIDWLVDGSADPIFTFTTYDKAPAVSVTIDYDSIGSASVLNAISIAVSQLPENGHHCIGIEDVNPSATPAP